MEDSIDLANALASDNWKQALCQYELKMIQRGFKNANKSMFSTKMLTARGWKASLRDTSMWIIGWGASIFSRK